MKWIMIPVAVVLLAVYTLLNYYIGLRGIQALGGLFGQTGRWVYWIFFWLLAYLYLGARFLQQRIPSSVDRWLIHGGAYWMAAMVYFLLILFLVDFGRMILWMTGSGLHHWTWQKPAAGVAVILAVLIILLYGTWNARTPRTVHYDVSLPSAHSNAAAIEVIRLAVVSDIHLGTIIRNHRLEKLVGLLNEMDPDMVLFVGDIIDENVNHFIDERMDRTLRKLNPPMGKYAVLGNHEYFGGHLDQIVYHLEASGIRVLRDEGVMIGNLFYLAGREDLMSERFTEKKRRPLSEILAEVDVDYIPVVLMDHQPKTWAEARDAGVRLQLSGHTHRGQLFPFGWITGHLFDEDWGRLEENGHTLIVSSGYGTWGPPVRTGNRPEIVVANLSIEGNR